MLVGGKATRKSKKSMAEQMLESFDTAVDAAFARGDIDRLEKLLNVAELQLAEVKR